MKRLLIALGLLLLTGCSSGQATPPWHTVWSESFAGPADASPDTHTWRYDTGRGIFGTGEVETMTSSLYNAHLDGRGNLDIIVLGHGAPGSTGFAWTSGRIQTRRLFAAPAGGEMEVSASIKQPDPASGLGYWPGFWMLGPKAWPMDGEIDILENVNGHSDYSGALHCGSFTHRNSDGTYGPCHEGDGLGSGLRACTGCQQGFHVYSVIIDRRQAGDEQVRWYFDGRQFFSVSESQIGRAAWTAAIDHGFSILLDVAVGGAFPDAQCRCTTPTGQTSSQAAMVIRYVKVSAN